MCGIVGYMDTLGTRPISAGLLRTMNDKQQHRGPDGDGMYLDAGVGLGHRRLSIIDLEGGKQPLFNEDGTVVVTYNGEIYNFRALEAELKQRGHEFRTRCDTEVIVHAWEEWGERCLDRFNGMFAFAIWDRNEETLFLARDRLGIKPLHYVFLPDGRLIFASELKALMAHPESPRALDGQAVEDYFTFGYVPDPKTIYSRIYKLEPGCFLKVRRGDRSSVPTRYWDVPLERQPDDQEESEAAARLIEELGKSVAARLVADVPLGAFLSGGIDSSAVVAMMRLANIDRLMTCSIGFKESQYDESKYADIVACAKKTDHRKELVEADDYDLLDKLVEIYDEPYADSSAIPTYRVCELARKHVTVALSGDGGDENFLGYRRYSYFALEERLRSLIPYRIRNVVFGSLGRIYPKLDRAPRFLRGKSTFEALARTSAEGYLHGVSICSEQQRSRLYSDDFERQLDGYRAGLVFENHLAGRKFSDPLRMVQYLDFKTYLPGDILTKVDRASMAHSLEVRVPFLDYQFVEWTANVPTNLKLRGGIGKRILKNSLGPYLPREILYRDKMGFAVPLDVWFRKTLSERMGAVVSGERLNDSGYFDSNQLQIIADEHISGRRNHSAVLWALLMFDGFLQNSP